LGRPKKIPTGLEARVLQLVNAPPVVDADQMSSDRKLTWSRLDSVPPYTWMRRFLGSPINKIDKVTFEELQLWSMIVPRHSKWDFRGFVSSNVMAIHFQKCHPGQLLPCVEDIGANTERFEAAFHSQPIKSVYSDIPLREDIYLFLKRNLKLFVGVGKTKSCLLLRDSSTETVRHRLMKWEEAHPYHISRLVKRDSNGSAMKLFRRYTYAALRGIGMKWPDKPFSRRARWPEVLRSIGLNVQEFDTTATSRNSQ